MASPVDQVISLALPNGQRMPLPLAEVDSNNSIMIVKCTGYGVEIGASLVMLAVIMTMTPKTKFWRFPTFLNIAALCTNVVRVILYLVYFNSSWVTFYALYSGDYSYVTRTDYANSVASTAMTIPQNIMMMWALILQAWAMIRFWPKAYRWGIFIWSIVLVLLEIGFMGASAAYQIIQLGMPSEQGYALIMKYVWVRYSFLGFEVACICWFCFLFICKLVTHLWKNRSFLPTTKGLGAMDALVMANGVLMLIPGKFTHTSPAKLSHIRTLLNLSGFQFSLPPCNIPGVSNSKQALCCTHPSSSSCPSGRWLRSASPIPRPSTASCPRPRA